MPAWVQVTTCRFSWFTPNTSRLMVPKLTRDAPCAYPAGGKTGGGSTLFHDAVPPATCGIRVVESVVSGEPVSSATVNSVQWLFASQAVGTASITSPTATPNDERTGK
jgi:hypothetical protein